MFHVELRMGMHVVREFNLSEQRLWVQFLAPLMADQDFTLAGHEFSPRQTRLKVYEGPQLRPDQLGMGRGWQNVERSAGDVTERVLARAREHTAVMAGPGTPATVAGSAAAGSTVAGSAAANSAAVDQLAERLIGRLSAGPIEAAEVVAIAAELMPGSDQAERLESGMRAVWELLERELAQLTPNGR